MTIIARNDNSFRIKKFLLHMIYYWGYSCVNSFYSDYAVGIRLKSTYPIKHQTIFFCPNYLIWKQKANFFDCWFLIYFLQYNSSFGIKSWIRFTCVWNFFNFIVLIKSPKNKLAFRVLKNKMNFKGVSSQFRFDTFSMVIVRTIHYVHIHIQLTRDVNINNIILFRLQFKFKLLCGSVSLNNAFYGKHK